ncbi:MAG: DNA repair protein RecO [Anaerolineales bacterium]
MGEADRLLTLYTRERGKLRVIAKGARKISSRKGGHLEPFTYVSLQLAQGRDLMIVTQAETVNPFLGIGATLIKTGYAAYALELLDRLMYEDARADAPTFNLLVETLSRIEKEADAWTAVRYYEMRLLDHAGFRPQLFECANCARAILPEDQFFSINGGGVICPRCGAGIPNLAHISLEALKYLRHFQRSSYREAARARPDEETRLEVETLMRKYFEYVLERQLNTPEFMQRVARR